MRTNRLYPKRGTGYGDGSETQTSSFSVGSEGDAGRGDRTVEEKTWFESLDSEDESEVDLVNHPPHYSNPDKKIETIDKIEDAVQFAPNPVLGGLQWQVLKYMDRLWDKENPKRDAEKARWYLNRLIQKLED